MLVHCHLLKFDDQFNFACPIPFSRVTTDQTIGILTDLQAIGWHRFQSPRRFRADDLNAIDRNSQVTLSRINQLECVFS